MSETDLILHVKGTEAETIHMAPQEVRAAAAAGRLNDSQLIWSAPETTWKPLKEWPDLAGEQLILHLKGTESGTRTLPQREVRHGVERGEITHSQLIWRPSENTWKPVRDLPELLSTPVPVPAGQPTLASKEESVASDSPETFASRAEVASTGSHAPAEGVPALRVPGVAAVLPPRSSVATVAPDLRTSSAAVMAFEPRAAGAPQPRPARVAATAPLQAAGPAPVAAKKPVLVQTTGDLVVEDDDSSHPLRWLCIIMGLVVAALVAVNFVLVDTPLVNGMKESRFSKVPVYAHLGAFVQPNVVVIHIPEGADVTEAKLPEFLVSLAQSTPNNPVTHGVFTRVALTSAWTAQYSFSGYAWKELGDMGRDKDAQRKDFILDQVDDAAGDPIVQESTLKEQEQAARREATWQGFASHFSH